MAIDSKIPEIAVLRRLVEREFGAIPAVHSDFVNLRDAVFVKTGEFVSESTLERIWGYSTRGYATVSRRTLDVVSRYAGSPCWDGFLARLKARGESESDLFDLESVSTSLLNPGDRLTIGWQPDRLCTVRYLGANRFVAEETQNSKLRPGDTFSCLSFQLHAPLFLEDLVSADGKHRGARYGVALRHGLTTLAISGPSEC